MKIEIDKKSDAAYIRLTDGLPFESEEVESGIVLDYNEAGEVIAIELLAVSKHLPLSTLASVEVVTA